MFVLFTAVQRRRTFGVTFCLFSVSSFHRCTEKVNLWCYVLFVLCEFCSPLYREGEPLVLRFVRSPWVLFTIVQRRWTFGVTFCLYSVSSFNHCTEKVNLWCYVLFVFWEFFGFRCCRTRPCCSWEGWSWRWRWRRWIYIGGSPSASSPWWDPNLICK